MNRQLQKAAFELYRWQCGGATNFTAKLFDLIAKADFRNREKLRTAFPMEVFVFCEWYASPTPKEFYTRYRLINEQGEPML